MMAKVLLGNYCLVKFVHMTSLSVMAGNLNYSVLNNYVCLFTNFMKLAQDEHIWKALIRQPELISDLPEIQRFLQSVVHAKLS